MDGTAVGRNGNRRMQVMLMQATGKAVRDDRFQGSERQAFLGSRRCRGVIFDPIITKEGQRGRVISVVTTSTCSEKGERPE